MKVILKENKLILEFLGSSWLSGVYLIESEVIGKWKVTLETRFHMIKFKNLDDDTTVTFNDDIADNIIDSITNIWNKFDITAEDAITIWIGKHRKLLKK